MKSRNQPLEQHFLQFAAQCSLDGWNAGGDFSSDFIHQFLLKLSLVDLDFEAHDLILYFEGSLFLPLNTQTSPDGEKK